MKKTILILLAMLAAVPAGFAEAETGPVNLLISGGNDNNAFHVALSPDGRSYTIVSTIALEVGGDICDHPEEIPNELFCRATAIAGFEVNSAGGSDSVFFTSDIPVPVTIRGGPGNDRLIGGGAADKIVGGPGDDVVTGRRGDDWILGGPGTDRLFGGPGNDQLRGGPDEDKLVGGPGTNELVP
jgi:Ca2+-binding RTX toxin-like protein